MYIEISDPQKMQERSIANQMFLRLIKWDRQKCPCNRSSQSILSRPLPTQKQSHKLKTNKSNFDRVLFFQLIENTVHTKNTDTYRHLQTLTDTHVIYLLFQVSSLPKCHQKKNFSPSKKKKNRDALLGFRVDTINTHQFLISSVPLCFGGSRHTPLYLPSRPFSSTFIWSLF